MSSRETEFSPLIHSINCFHGNRSQPNATRLFGEEDESCGEVNPPVTSRLLVTAPHSVTCLLAWSRVTLHTRDSVCLCNTGSVRIMDTNTDCGVISTSPNACPVKCYSCWRLVSGPQSREFRPPHHHHYFPSTRPSNQHPATELREVTGVERSRLGSLLPLTYTRHDEPLTFQSNATNSLLGVAD